MSRQRCRGPRLALEALHEHCLRRQLLRQDLDRDAPPEQPVLGEPHRAHAAGGDQLDHPIALGQR
jgi:hypothetical protein